MARRPFALMGRGRASLAARTAALRSWLHLCEPRVRAFSAKEGWPYATFGLWDPESGSLALVQEDQLVAYGGLAAQEALLARLHAWVELGMPGAASMRVRAYPRGGAPAPAGSGEYLLRRPATDFLFSVG